MSRHPIFMYSLSSHWSSSSYTSFFHLFRFCLPPSLTQILTLILIFNIKNMSIPDFHHPPLLKSIRSPIWGIKDQHWYTILQNKGSSRAYNEPTSDISFVVRVNRKNQQNSTPKNYANNLFYPHFGPLDKQNLLHTQCFIKINNVLRKGSSYPSPLSTQAISKHPISLCLSNFVFFLKKRKNNKYIEDLHTSDFWCAFH